MLVLSLTRVILGGGVTKSSKELVVEVEVNSVGKEEDEDEEVV